MRPGTTPPKKGRGSRLTALQLRFVEEYCSIDEDDPEKSLNGTKAVLRAGYNTKNPNRIASELLRHPVVSAEIKKRLDAREDRLELTHDYIINRLLLLSDKAGRDSDKIRSLELLGRTLSMFKDRQEISGPDGEAIKHEQKVQEDVADFTRSIQRLTSRNSSKNEGLQDVSEQDVG